MQRNGRISRMAIAFVLAAGLTATVSPARAQSAMGQEKTLYQRLGGYDAIAAVTDDFIQRLATDTELGRFFGGHSKDSLGRLRQLVVDQICFATGGPCLYIGRDMKTAHAGLGISSADWDRSVQHLIATLDTFHVPAKEKNDLLAVVGTLKADIVEKM
jgi:hemoglobin